MTLKGYYDSLPQPDNPRRSFILSIMQRLNVVESTVFNWLSGRSRPSDPKHIAVLSELTGIKPEDLWED